MYNPQMRSYAGIYMTICGHIYKSTVFFSHVKVYMALTHSISYFFFLHFPKTDYTNRFFIQEKFLEATHPIFWDICKIGKKR